MPLLHPTSITLEQVATPLIVALQAQMSKVVWRPAPGRKLGFLVRHEAMLLGLIFLTSPVISMECRDRYLQLQKVGRGKALRHYADLSVCVGIQPLAWYWNLGKLLALIATTVGDTFLARYGDELKGIITTSVWGRSSQYNRIYKQIGATKGFGHEHISETRYQQMLQWLRDNGHPVPSCRFGAGSNPRMRRIMAYRKASGDLTATVYHGHSRGVYYHPAISAAQREQVISDWYVRWGWPRYTRMKDQLAPYQTGLDPNPNREPRPEG